MSISNDVDLSQRIYLNGQEFQIALFRIANFPQRLNPLNSPDIGLSKDLFVVDYTIFLIKVFAEGSDTRLIVQCAMMIQPEGRIISLDQVADDTYVSKTFLSPGISQAGFI